MPTMTRKYNFRCNTAQEKGRRKWWHYVLIYIKFCRLSLLTVCLQLPTKYFDRHLEKLNFNI